jgi:hypothetical protein
MHPLTRTWFDIEQNCTGQKLLTAWNMVEGGVVARRRLVGHLVDVSRAYSEKGLGGCYQLCES